MTDWNHATPLAAAAAYPKAMIALRVEGSDPTNPALDTFEQITVASVIAAAALNIPSAAQAVSIDLFINIAAHAMPVGVTAFVAGGYSIGGSGGGTYVADRLATSALASNCPQFCAADSTGRHFRLMAAGGVVAISQAGALGGTNNDQPAVQAAINYCGAIGARALLFDFDTVSIWNTVRTSNAGQNTTAAWAQDGQSIWVTAPIKFMGLPTQTHLKMLSTTGGSLETGWQNVGGNVWRGSGINLLGGPSAGDQTSYNNAWFAMENIWLDGGCQYTGVRTAPTPTSPDGPDLTDKGIRQQNTSVANIHLRNCKITGFKGETFYVGGGNFFLDGVTMAGSNQSCFNPSTGYLKAVNCDFGNTNSAFEILGGVGGSMVNCRFFNCIQVSCTGGPAGGTGTQWNYATVNRVTTQTPPWFDFVDCEFANCGTFLGGNYIRFFHPRVTDTLFVFSTALTMGEFSSTYIRDMEYTVDQINAAPIVNLQGPANLTTSVPTGLPSAPNTPPAADVHMRMNVHRSPLAIANNHYAIPYAVTGEIDTASCSLAVGEADGVLAIHSANYGGTTLQLPLLICDGPTNSQAISGAGVPYGMTVLGIPSGPYAVGFTNPRMGLQYSGAATAIACTMATTYTPAHGQKCRIYWYGSTAGTTFTFAHNGTGWRLNSDATLAVAFDWIEGEFNGSTGLWHEIGRSIHAA